MNPQDLNTLANVRAFCASGKARSLRIRRRLSLREMATAVGVSQSTVHRWELGERSPHGDAALRYAAILEELAK